MSGLNMQGVIASGRRFYDSIMALDKRKHSLSLDEVTAAASYYYNVFIEEAKISVVLTFIFCEIHEIIGFKWHTELAHVTVQDHRCQIAFPIALLKKHGPFDGLIFVAKSWPILVLIDRIFSDGTNLSSSFIFEIGDGATLDQVCYTSTNPNSCLIVDYDFVTARGYEQFRDRCRRGIPSWKDRIPKAFWRGATTGARLYQPPKSDDEDSLEWLDRLILCKRSRDPDVATYCDIGISNIVQVDEAFLIERLQRSGLLKPQVDRFTFTNYMGNVDVDGNANAWSGLFCSLLGGSCVLKVKSRLGHHQWYYSDLAPWAHYIPISADLSDFRDAVMWLVHNRDKAEFIAAAGRQFALNLDVNEAFRQSAKNLVSWIRKRKPN